MPPRRTQQHSIRGLQRRYVQRYERHVRQLSSTPIRRPCRRRRGSAPCTVLPSSAHESPEHARAMPVEWHPAVQQTLSVFFSMRCSEACTLCAAVLWQRVPPFRCCYASAPFRCCYAFARSIFCVLVAIGKATLEVVLAKHASGTVLRVGSTQAVQVWQRSWTSDFQALPSCVSNCTVLQHLVHMHKLLSRLPHLPPTLHLSPVNLLPSPKGDRLPAATHTAISSVTACPQVCVTAPDTDPQGPPSLDAVCWTSGSRPE